MIAPRRIFLPILLAGLCLAGTVARAGEPHHHPEGSPPCPTCTIERPPAESRLACKDVKVHLRRPQECSPLVACEIEIDRPTFCVEERPATAEYCRESARVECRTEFVPVPREEIRFEAIRVEESRIGCVCGPAGPCGQPVCISLQFREPSEVLIPCRKTVVHKFPVERSSLEWSRCRAEVAYKAPVSIRHDKTEELKLHVPKCPESWCDEVQVIPVVLIEPCHKPHPMPCRDDKGHHHPAEPLPHPSGQGPFVR